MTILGSGFTAIEIEPKYSRLNKNAFVPGTFLRKFARVQRADALASDLTEAALVRTELRTRRLLFTIGRSGPHWSRYIFLSGAFNVLAADVPDEVATTWLIVRSDDSFAKVARVPLGITLRELPEYFRDHDNEIEDDAWYGLLVSFSGTE